MFSSMLDSTISLVGNESAAIYFLWGSALLRLQGVVCALSVGVFWSTVRIPKTSLLLGHAFSGPFVKRRIL